LISLQKHRSKKCIPGLISDCSSNVAVVLLVVAEMLGGLWQGKLRGSFFMAIFPVEPLVVLG